MLKITQWIRDVPTPYSSPEVLRSCRAKPPIPNIYLLLPPPPHSLSVLQTDHTSTNIQLSQTLQILLNTHKRNPSNKSVQCPCSSTMGKILNHKDINLCLQTLSHQHHSAVRNLLGFTPWPSTVHTFPFQQGKH